MNISSGAIITFFILNIGLILYGAAFTVSVEDCGNIPGWACGTPLESLKSAAPSQLNFFQVALGALTGTINAVFGLLTMDYDILKGDGDIIGGMGFIIRATGWLMLALASIGALWGIVRR